MEGGQFFFSVLFFSWLKALYECSFSSLLDISLFSFAVQIIFIQEELCRSVLFWYLPNLPPLPSKMK